MLASSYPLVKDSLTDTERRRWRDAIERAADDLVRVMRPEFASINYCATTAASLAMAHLLTAEKHDVEKARKLARQVAAKMNEDGFITGEGGRIRGVKYGVDLDYDLDISLWGLGLYAKLTQDVEVNLSAMDPTTGGFSTDHPASLCTGMTMRWRSFRLRVSSRMNSDTQAVWPTAGGTPSMMRRSKNLCGCGIMAGGRR